jgi:hypothetical protein
MSPPPGIPKAPPPKLFRFLGVFWEHGRAGHSPLIGRQMKNYKNTGKAVQHKKTKIARRSDGGARLCNGAPPGARHRPLLSVRASGEEAALLLGRRRGGRRGSGR